MAITRRQFVTRLGALAAAAGMGQADVSRIAEVFAYGTGGQWPGTGGKPTVVWIHGAECTGCSTSLLSTYEDATGTAVYQDRDPLYSTLAAVNLATGGAVTSGSSLTLHANGLNVDTDNNLISIQDVLIDVIDLAYHETVMGMGGDLAYQWLLDFKDNNEKPFVLVVEGALQRRTLGGAWNDTSSTLPWCSIGMDGTIGATAEHDMGEMVGELATMRDAGDTMDLCPAVISIGQCASYGGYPGCKSPLDSVTAGFDTSKSQTGALGTADYLHEYYTGAEAKVINVPGCPANPWWFILTVVAWLVDADAALASVRIPAGTNSDGPLGILAAGGAIKASAVDYGGRLKVAYPTAVHGAMCPKFQFYAKGIFAEKPGDQGCLQKIGCKGPAAKSSCGIHGWNSQQPENTSLTADSSLHSWNNSTVLGSTAAKGGNCTRAGHPCMACTEKGYPDSFVPFVVRS